MIDLILEQTLGRTVHHRLCLPIKKKNSQNTMLEN